MCGRGVWVGLIYAHIPLPAANFDFQVPYDKTLETLEGIVLDYIKELCERAMNVGKTDKLALEDIHYLIRRDPKKFARVKDLLSMSEELKKARKQFDDVKQL
ncbi:unnamed protein product [Heligmosomoides polygyrus]|uniref:Transcription initiation factor TFIID subunit 13 n=1 Tax=Heligmosomoides polygyrus TaxID=6339 RepID=A0A183FXX7_HELPZ|nr:unnamed protein product [Heligmosomoides polygyrus]